MLSFRRRSISKGKWKEKSFQLKLLQTGSEGDSDLRILVEYLDAEGYLETDIDQCCQFGFCQKK